MSTAETDGTCPFCAIIAGTAEASLVAADEHVVAFLTIRPATAGHLLVLPRAHVSSLADLEPELGARVFAQAQRLAAALRRSGLPCEGVNLILADGAAAFQTVFHMHFHVIPRVAGDGLRLDGDWRFPDRAELERVAASIRRGLDSLNTKTIMRKMAAVC